MRRTDGHSEPNSCLLHNKSNKSCIWATTHISFPATFSLIKLRNVNTWFVPHLGLSNEPPNKHSHILPDGRDEKEHLLRAIFIILKTNLSNRFLKRRYFWLEEKSWLTYFTSSCVCVCVFHCNPSNSCWDISSRNHTIQPHNGVQGNIFHWVSEEFDLQVRVDEESGDQQSN